MHWIHDLVAWWFGAVEQWGYIGVFFLMALESTIVPIPSEAIMPPAAYAASQGKMNVWGVVLAGAAGSTFGSASTWWVSLTAGRAFLVRYGKWFRVTEHHLALAEAWVKDFALGGVFFARLLPVVRHLIGFPAGLVRMPFGPFCAVTFVGSFAWCGILSWFSIATLGQRPDLLSDPAALEHVLRHDLLWFIGLVAGLAAGWFGVVLYGRRRVDGHGGVG